MLESSVSSSHPGGKLWFRCSASVELPTGDCTPTDLLVVDDCDWGLLWVGFGFFSSRVHWVDVKVRADGSEDRRRM